VARNTQTARHDAEPPRANFQGPGGAGTYELLAMRDLSGQLGRRSIDVHLRCYHATNEEDRKAFKLALRTFQKLLPLEPGLDLVKKWQYCYAHTIGCIGILKDWLTLALIEALDTPAGTITLDILEHRSSLLKCL
jgi:hypothetical protein